MARTLTFVLVAAAWLDGCVASQFALAAEPLQKSEVEQLLEVGWSTKSESRAEATKLYDELFERVGSDTRLVQAHILLKIKQRQYAEAIRIVDSQLTDDKPRLDLLRTKVWITVLLKQYGSAALAAEKLAAAIPPLTDPPGDSEDANEDLARFLGRVQGYMDGPVAGAFPEGKRTALRKKILEHLSGERKVAYLEGRDAVLEQYLSLSGEKESRREKSKDEAEKERDERLVELNETRDQAAQRAKELESRTGKLRAELSDELKELQKQDSPLALRFAQLDAQGATVRRELNLIDSERVRYEALLAREKDPNLQQMYVRELARLDALFARLDINFAAVARQAAGVASQRADLERRAAIARNTAGQQIGSAEREQVQMERRGRSADGEERRLRNKNVGENTPGVLAKAAQAAAFTTYEPFPLDEQRRALLDSFNVVSK